jgi:hypothetical protein
MAEGETVQNIYDEIEIDDMDFEEGKFYYPCPCGDKFQITLVSIGRQRRSPIVKCYDFGII